MRKTIYAKMTALPLSLIHIYEPTRLNLIADSGVGV